MLLAGLSLLALACHGTRPATPAPSKPDIGRTRPSDGLPPEDPSLEPPSDPAPTPSADAAVRPDANAADGARADLTGPVSAPDAGVSKDTAGAVADAAPRETGLAPVDGGGPFVPNPSAMSIAVYDESALVDFHLGFPPGEWERLLILAGPSATRWVSCTFSALGSAATPAACRRKGDGLDWANEKKPQIIVRFNLTDKQGRFRGLRRLNLEAFEGTEAPVRDRVGMWLMREAGIDAPRVNHARVFKDGQYLGLYQNIESLDKEFLEDHYGPDSNGNLWEGGFELKTNEDTPDTTRINALWDLIGAEPLTGDHRAFFARVATMIDVGQVLREMAAETALLADDNFSNGSTNFSYYDHPRRGFVVLPWDFDSIITGWPAGSDLYHFLGFSAEPNKLRQLMNQNPIWKKQFEDELIQIRDDVLTRVPARVDLVCSQISEAIKTDPNRTSTFEDFEADCAQVKDRIRQRIAAMKQVLGR